MEVAQAYVGLAYGIEQHFPGYIDAYYGPEGWKHSQKLSLEELSRQAEELSKSLGSLESSRQIWLEAQVRAMQTTLALLEGETIPYREEVRRVYDIEAEAVPEARFETAIHSLDSLLPGDGAINGRWQAFRERFVVPPDQVEEVLELLTRRLRGRVRERYRLPGGESFTVELVKNQPWGGYNWYLGGYRSRIAVNTDLPTYLYNLPDIMAHEGYPGHHTEGALKEHQLYRERGQAEVSVALINSPQCVISEGIAVKAREMVLSEGEEGEWLSEMAQLAGLGVGKAEIEAVGQVNRQLEELRYVSGNVALGLHEKGMSEGEALEYFQRYRLLDPAQANKQLEFLRYPLNRGYVFTYTAGGDLLDALFKAKGDAELWFNRLLTEALTPGTVRGWIDGQESPS